MKPGQSPTAERFAPPPPPRQNRYATAPRPTSYAPQSAGAQPNTPGPRPRRSWDEFKRPNRAPPTAEPSPGFPGLSRTQSSRPKQSFAPTTPGGDEPPAPRSSAYATYVRGERPQASHPQSYFPEPPPTQPSPQPTPQRPVVSPLRHVRSSSGIEEDRRPQRPNLERVSSRYSGVGGERTDLGHMGQSASVRNSPVDSRYHEHDRNGLHRPFSHEGPPARHTSPSPKSRPAPVIDSSSSDSETSSSDDDSEVQKFPGQAQTTSRQTYQKPASAGAADSHAFTGQFPGTNYVRPPNAPDTNHIRFQYRPPPPPRNQPTSQAAFNYVPSYTEPRPTAHQTPHQPAPGNGNGYAAPGAAGNGPNMYAPFHFCPRIWSQSLRSFLSRSGKDVPSLNGFPSWAVPSSVLPRRTDTAQKCTLDTIHEEKHDWIKSWQSNDLGSSLNATPCKWQFADSTSSNSSSSETEPPEGRQPGVQSASQEDVSRKFSAAEWNEKLSGAEDIFRPTPTESQRRASPVRPTKSRARSYSKGESSPTKEPKKDFSSSVNGSTQEGSRSSEAFVPGKFSAEEWAEKLQYQAAAGATEDAKIPKRPSKVPPLKRQPTFPRPASISTETAPSVSTTSGTTETTQKMDVDIDAMDIDESMTDSGPPPPAGDQPTASATDEAHAPGAAQGADPPHAAAADVSLHDLSNVAPFKPSDTGLGDLKDLNHTLPFESRPSPARPSHSMTNGVGFASLKALNLPKPPRDVIPPLENMNQEAWTRYTAEMTAYMHEWRIFNKRMLDHFQARQAQLDMTLTSNWMSSMGDGPSGEDVSCKLHEDATSPENRKAGYAAYREWMEEDMRVREWWNVACERHMHAVIELGKIRERAKAMAAI
jgi:hypothetical protein